jgi:excisionase family DNA binding protein
MKTIFTTGQVAKICKVAPRTVSKWFDSGRLRGYRIPGSQDRRIPREHLIRFLKEHGMPLGELEDEAMGKILLVGSDLTTRTSLNEMISNDDFKIEIAASGFEAGIQAESIHPDCVVVDFVMGREEALMIAQNLRREHRVQRNSSDRSSERRRQRFRFRPFGVSAKRSENRSTQLCWPNVFERSSTAESSWPEKPTESLGDLTTSRKT